MGFRNMMKLGCMLYLSTQSVCASANTESSANTIDSLILRANTGDTDALYHIGKIYLNDPRVKLKREDILRWTQEALEKQHSGAIYSAALLVGVAGGVKESVLVGKDVYETRVLTDAEQEKRFSLMTTSAELGYAEAQNTLGSEYLFGGYVRQDNKIACRWFEAAASNGFPEGQLNLAFCYMEGKGGVTDYSKMLTMFKSAAEQGHGRAIDWLSKIYKNGYFGYTIDEEKSTYWATQLKIGKKCGLKTAYTYKLNCSTQ